MIADLAAQRALDRMGKVGFENLSEAEKTVATVWLFESKVANDGFEKLYRSSAGEVAFYAPEAFRKIGAKTLAEIAAEANSVFGPAGPARNMDERIANLQAQSPGMLEKWKALEERFFCCAEETDELLERYLNQQTDTAAHG